MICGALQTLNEEACEDVMEETECDNAEGTDLPLTYVVPPSPENVQGDSTIASFLNSDLNSSYQRIRSERIPQHGNNRSVNRESTVTILEPRTDPSASSL